MKAYAILGWIGFIITCILFVVGVIMSGKFLGASLLLILAPVIPVFCSLTAKFS